MYITQDLAEVIRNQDTDLSNYNEDEALKRIKKVKQEKEKQLKRKCDEILAHLEKKEKADKISTRQRCRLSGSPIKVVGYVLNKQEFRDSICLRYG